MRAFEVRFHPAAARDLVSIESYIVAASGRAIGEAYGDRLREACARLATGPRRGSIYRRDPVEIRTLGFERSATIAFAVEPHVHRVIVLGIFYRGRDVYSAMAARI